ncbi:MAG: methylenetetrahydrofolate reductase [Actinobacteria bacterium]|nr:methylenetetrahydrofolate reductase [Actinomycetota bacterium]
MKPKSTQTKNIKLPVTTSSFEDALAKGKFAITCEFGPPKGVGTEEIRSKAKILKGLVDGVNVSDLQSSLMSLGSIATCHLLKDIGLEPILQITCRDRNRLALQSDLLSAYVLGIKNVLVLTGDYPTMGDHPQAKPVFDLDSVQLLWAIKRLEEGYDIAGNELTTNPTFFKGAALNPNADTDVVIELQLIKMKKKIDQGAQFFQTQPIFDARLFEKFMERVSKININVPIIAGIMLLKSEKMANYINKFIPGIHIPEPLINKIVETEDKVSMSLEIATSIINKIKPICAGIHIGIQGWEEHIPALLKKVDID